MNEVANYLLKHGATSVDALFAHAPLEAAAAKNMGVFSEIYTTNTCVSLVPHSWVKLDVLDYILAMN